MATLGTIIKDPADILDYTFSYEKQMIEDGNDTITTSSWTLPTGLTEVSNSHNTMFSTVWISGGTAGNDYICTNRISTTGGRTYERSFTLRLRDL